MGLSIIPALDHLRRLRVGGPVLWNLVQMPLFALSAIPVSSLS